MSFCPNCGRPVNDNEVCICQKQRNSAQNNPQPNNAPQFNPNFNPNGKPLYDEFGRPLFTAQGEPITYDANGKPKVKRKKTGCIIAIVICLLVFLLVAAIFAAILIPAMLGYTKKSRASQANANAKVILSYASTTLEEMKENDYSFDGTYLISSDKSENVNCEDIDTKTFYSTFESYATEDLASKDWFIVIEDGIAVYSVIDSNHYIGTYPARAGLGANDVSNIPLYTGDEIPEDSDFDEVYEANCEKIASGARTNNRITAKEFKSLTNAAKEIISNANYVLTDMDEQGLLFNENSPISEKLIISSDESKNRSCENFDTELFYDIFYKTVQTDSYDEWFVVVEDGVAIYSAIDDNGLIGTYPERANPEANYTSLIPLHTGVYAPHDSDFEYIYEANCRELRNR